MPRGTRIKLAAFAALALAGPCVFDALWTSDEERVEASLVAIEAGLEARDADAVIAWFAEDVEVARPIPGLPARRPLGEGLREVLDELTVVVLSRDSSVIDLSTAGQAHVVTSGTCRFETVPFASPPMRFEFDLIFEGSIDGRFLLRTVERVSFSSILR